MKKALGGLVLIAALATSGTAWTVPQTPAIAALQRQVAWDARHIRHLEHRRTYLHRYIRQLRHPTPLASTTSTSTSSQQSYSGGWGPELAAVGFPASAIPHMEYIINRESGGDPNAVNSSSGACGLLQLYPCYGGSAWLDPMTNLRLGFQKYQASGFAPWGG